MKIKKIKVGQGVHYILNVLVNKQRARFLIDTGASRTVIDSTHLYNYITMHEMATTKMIQPMAGIGGVSSQVNEITIDKFQIESLIWQNYKFLSSSLKNVNDQYQSFGLKHIQGILGCDLLSEGKAWIDLMREEIYFQ